MGSVKYNTIIKKGTHFTWEQRLILERLLSLRGSKKKSRQEISDILGKCKRTIQREIKKGAIMKLESNLTESKKYNAYRGQQIADQNLSQKGPKLKLGADFELAQSISYLIKHNHFSPDAVIMNYNKKGWPTTTRISTRTLYRYIYEGMIPEVSNWNLLHKGNKYHRKNSTKRRHSRVASANKSISNRSPEVESRTTFGHWEMDCIVSGKNKGKAALLTLTERSNRYQIIRKINDQTTKSVIAELNKLERQLGVNKFKNIFKSITCDNGSEFMDYDGIEKSCLCTNLRTTIYYAHPYSSFERGSNENANGVIRRFIKKGTAIKKVTIKRIRMIQEWMNNYPRKILNGYSSHDLCHLIIN
jgi:transposase, IS30 family